MIFPLRKENLFIQLFAFLFIWVILQMLFMYGWGQYLLHFFDSSDVKTLLIDQQHNPHFRTSIIWGNALQQVCTFALPAILFGVLSCKRPLQYIGFNNSYSYLFDIKRLPLIAIVMLMVLPKLAELIQLIPLGNWSDELQETRRLMESFYFDDKEWWALLRNLFLMAFIPAFCEELFFRGMFQRFIYSSTKNMWIAILATGIFFSFLHASAVNFLPIVGAAVILGLIYHYTKNIWWSILTHFIYNGIQVLLNFINDNPSAVENVQDNSISHILKGSFGAIIGIIALIIFFKKMHKIYQEHVAGDDHNGHWSFEDKTLKK